MLCVVLTVSLRAVNSVKKVSGVLILDAILSTSANFSLIYPLSEMRFGAIQLKILGPGAD